MAPVKIALLGGECSGKSTLAQKLARYFGGLWNPEFARIYVERREQFGLISNQQDVRYPDVEAIGWGQLAAEYAVLEAAAIQTGKQVIFFDTTLLMTKVYSQLFYGRYPLWLDKAIAASKFDRYFLLTPSLPWQPDPQRSSPAMRATAYQAIAQALTNYGFAYQTIGGDMDERFGIIREKTANCLANA